MYLKHFALSIIAAVSVYITSAQKQLELHAGYGMYSWETMLYEMPSGGNLIPDLTTKGSYFVTARYRIFERFALGITVNHYRPQQVFGAGPDFVFYYNYQSLFRIYMSGAMGIHWQLHQGKTGNMLFYYSPIGLRVGKTFAAFTELGFGSKGLLNFGMSYMPGGN